MADKSGIEWTDATWNPIAGCSILSKGCSHCYAMPMAARLEAMGQAKYAGLTKTVNGKPVWTGKIAVAGDDSFAQPLRWTKPRRIFVNSMSDLFHEAVPTHVIDKVFAIMALTPQHTYQLLTKRPERMRDYLLDPLTNEDSDWTERLADEAAALAGSPCAAHVEDSAFPLPNVWLGVSVEDQATADARIPILLDTPAAVRWISAEPLLGPIDLKPRDKADQCIRCGQGPDAPHNHPDGYRTRGLDWVVVGGESGPDARPMHPDWVRDMRDQCTAAGVPFFFKQWGEWAPGETATRNQTRTERTASWWNGKWRFDTITPKVSEEMHVDDEPDLYRFGKHSVTRTLDGRTHDEYPR